MSQYPTQVRHVPKWLRSVSLVLFDSILSLGRLPTLRAEIACTACSIRSRDSKSSLRFWLDLAKIVVVA
jgi:hypothetical protein